MAKTKEKKKLQFPHPIIFILILSVIMMCLSWVVPAGYYKAIDANGIIAGEEGYDETTGVLVYDEEHYISPGEPAKIGVWTSIQQIVAGFNGAKSVVFLILVAFSTIYVIEATGALDALVASCVRMAEKRPKAGPIMLVIIMYLMALWGGTGTLS